MTAQSLHQKLLDHELGGGALISTEEMCAHLRTVADGEYGAMDARFLREVAERLEMYQAERRVAPDLVAALKEIADGLADTKSTPGKWMTRITKPDAHAIARAAIAESGASA